VTLETEVTIGNFRVECGGSDQRATNRIKPDRSAVSCDVWSERDVPSGDLWSVPPLCWRQLKGCRTR
jgi:hypothetical protein